jgi:hypothetical protein
MVCRESSISSSYKPNTRGSHDYCRAVLPLTITTSLYPKHLCLVSRNYLHALPPYVPRACHSDIEEGTSNPSFRSAFDAQRMSQGPQHSTDTVVYALPCFTHVSPCTGHVFPPPRGRVRYVYHRHRDCASCSRLLSSDLRNRHILPLWPNGHPIYAVRTGSGWRHPLCCTAYQCGHLTPHLQSGSLGRCC